MNRTLHKRPLIRALGSLRQQSRRAPHIPHLENYKRLSVSRLNRNYTTKASKHVRPRGIQASITRNLEHTRRHRGHRGHYTGRNRYSEGNRSDHTKTSTTRIELLENHHGGHQVHDARHHTAKHKEEMKIQQDAVAQLQQQYT